MPEARFDFEKVFDPETYLYFYEPMLTPENSEHETNVAWQLLGIEPGMEVLDLACGFGRIANRLAALGARVTGVDASEAFLEMARRDAEERGVEVELVHGDMRSIPWTERFDCVISWFTSYGYFEDDDNRQVLTEVFG